MSEPVQPRPVPVHITSVEAGISTGPAPAPARPVRTEFGTETVDDANPVRPLLPASGTRVIAQVQASGGDVLLCESQAKAEQASGSLLASGNTAPWPLGGQQPVWITQVTSGDTCTVSWTADYRV